MKNFLWVVGIVIVVSMLFCGCSHRGSYTLWGRGESAPFEQTRLGSQFDSSSVTDNERANISIDKGNNSVTLESIGSEIASVEFTFDTDRASHYRIEAVFNGAGMMSINGGIQKALVLSGSKKSLSFWSQGSDVTVEVSVCDGQEITLRSISLEKLMREPRTKVVYRYLPTSHRYTRWHYHYSRHTIYEWHNGYLVCYKEWWTRTPYRSWYSRVEHNYHYYHPVKRIHHWKKPVGGTRYISSRSGKHRGSAMWDSRNDKPKRVYSSQNTTKTKNVSQERKQSVSKSPVKRQVISASKSRSSSRSSKTPVQASTSRTSQKQTQKPAPQRQVKKTRSSSRSSARTVQKAPSRKAPSRSSSSSTEEDEEKKKTSSSRKTRRTR